MGPQSLEMRREMNSRWRMGARRQRWARGQGEGAVTAWGTLGSITGWGPQVPGGLTMVLCWLTSDCEFSV